jgi:hypothetical protein
MDPTKDPGSAFLDDGVMAFTDFGTETLTELIEGYKVNPQLLKRSIEPK